MKLWQMLLGGEDSKINPVANYAGGADIHGMHGLSGDKFIVSKPRAATSGIALSEISAGWVGQPALTIDHPITRFGFINAMEIRGSDIYCGFAYSIGGGATDDFFGLLKTNALTGLTYQTRFQSTGVGSIANGLVGPLAVGLGSNFSAWMVNDLAQGGIVKLNESGAVQFFLKFNTKFGFGAGSGGSGRHAICVATDDSIVAIMQSGGNHGLLKLNSAGAIQWAKSISSDHEIRSVCSDGSGGVYACGLQTADSVGFVARINSGGTITWCRKITAAGNRGLNEVFFDASRNIVVLFGPTCAIALTTAGALFWGRSFPALGGGGYLTSNACLTDQSLVAGEVPTGDFIKFPLADGGVAGTYASIGLVAKILPAGVVTESVATSNMTSPTSSNEAANHTITTPSYTVATGVAATGTWTKIV